MIQFIRFFFSNESGATAIEYGIIAAGILVAIIATIGILGGSVANMFIVPAEFVDPQ